MKINTLNDLYIDQLRDLFDAENQLVKALPTVIKTATNQELKNAVEDHLEQTKEHVSRLAKIFESADQNPKGKKCAGMAGLIDECKELIDEDIEPEVLDAGLIACAQRVEHYEIAAYGCCVTYAKLLGKEEDADQLQQTLDEEKEADETLTDIAESTINVEAAESAHAGAEKQGRGKK